MHLVTRRAWVYLKLLVTLIGVTVALVAFDTLRCIKHLTAAGIPAAHAEALADVLAFQPQAHAPQHVSDAEQLAQAIEKMEAGFTSLEETFAQLKRLLTHP
ncbi:hypothetical protein B398_04305 [Xylella fastidiosa 32]|nr:hypothetical protein B398_04305 [Xylella fastidiosa 32]KXB21612.1 hypothetical protein ADT30_03090 [Xylella fastidiosa]